MHRAAVCDLALEGTGTRAVSGLGFKPGLVLAAVGAGSKAGEPRSGLAVGFGAAALPSKQAACGFVGRFGGVERLESDRQHAHQVAHARRTPPAHAPARLVSFDRDGFTLETTNLASGSRSQSLRWKEAVIRSAWVLRRRGRRRWASRRGALLNARSKPERCALHRRGRLCVGGFSRDQRAGCVSWSTLRRGAWPPEPRSRSTAEAVFEVIDTTSGELHARATLASLGRRRFRLSWPVLESPPRDFGYVAFGEERRKATLRDRLRLLDHDGAFPE